MELSSFWGIFAVGFIQLLSCILITYLLAKYLPDWSFLLSFLSLFVLGILFFYASKKRLGILLSSFLCFAPAVTGKDILYIESLLTPISRPQQEQIYNLEPGEIDFQKSGLYSCPYRSGSKSKTTTYDYYFVAPYLKDRNPIELDYWFVIPKEWMEDNRWTANLCW